MTVTETGTENQMLTEKASGQAEGFSDELLSTLKKMNLSVDEYRMITGHLKRDPNLTELAVFSVLWSEHCCYKSSRHLLRKFPNHSPRVMAGPGENAGVVDVGDGIQIAFKIESHNHPTAVEPYQGATTGVGGILRDIFTMNARPIANLNSLRFGPQSEPRNQYLFQGAVKGIGDYGNCVGVPTIAGEVFFDPSYSGNPLVNAMSIGVLYDGNITSAKVHGVGNPVLYVGNVTGRDGMGGAAFASKELDEQSHDDRPAVQVGDPFCEKLLIEACLEAFATGCVVAAQDMGAAGLSSSSSEMAAKGGVGMRLDLDKVPAREPDMQAVEYLLSESQERMLFVLEKGREQPVLDVFAKWNLPAVIIGEVIDVNQSDVENNGYASLEIYRHGKKEVDLPAALLSELTPDYDRKITPVEPKMSQERRLRDARDFPDITLREVPAVLQALISSDNLASPKPVWRQYDRHVQNNTLLSSENLTAGVIRLRQKDGAFSNKAIAASTDCNARYVYLNPYVGSATAVAESVRNLACVGAEPLAVTDNLNFGNPEKDEIYYQLYQSVEGISEACRQFDVPVISGNVSLYNEFKGQSIMPAPVIGTVGLIEAIDQLTLPGASFPKAGLKLALLGDFKPALGGSEYQWFKRQSIYGEPPTLNLALERELAHCVWLLVGKNLLASVQDISMGGLLPTLSECLFENGLGAQLNLDAILAMGFRLDETLFGETNGCYLLAYEPEQEKAIAAYFGNLPENCALLLLGETTEEGELAVDAACRIETKKLKSAWQSRFQ